MRHVLAKKDIVRAAHFGRLDLVQQCLGQNEEEAICAAIKEGHTSVVEYLLATGAYTFSYLVGCGEIPESQGRRSAAHSALAYSV